MLCFWISITEYLVTRNLSDIFINTNKVNANLIIANPLGRQ